MKLLIPILFFCIIPTTAHASMRIIAIGAPTVEIICALGMEDAIVARSSWDTFPPSVLRLPSMGSPFSPNLEFILTLKPDLVILGNDMDIIQQKLKKYEIPFLTINTYNTIDIIPSINKLAVVLKCKEKSRKLIHSLTELRRIAEQGIKNIPESSKLKGVMLTESTSMFAVTSSSGNSLLQDSGALNCADGTQRPYPTLSKEWLLHNDINFILIPMQNNQNNLQDNIRNFKLFDPSLFKKTKLIFIDEKLTYGIRAYLGSLLLAAQLYPENFVHCSYAQIEYDFLKEFFPSALEYKKISHEKNTR